MKSSAQIQQNLLRAFAPRSSAWLPALVFTLGTAAATAQMRIVPTISTLAGTGAAAFSGDGSQAAAAAFNAPSGLVFDNTGNLYISDAANQRIRKISPTGVISTVAGTGTAGFNGDGPALSAQLNHPVGLAADTAGNIYIADSFNNRIRKFSPSNGTLTTVAGTGAAGFSGDGAAATLATLNLPLGVAVDPAGNLFFSDSNNNRIREVLATNASILTYAGSGPAGPGTGSFSGDNGLATKATFNQPGAMYLEASDIVVWDAGNHRLRGVGLIVYGQPTSSVYELAGNGSATAGGDHGYPSQASFVNITAIGRSTSAISLIDNNQQSGALYLVDSGASQVREIDDQSDIVTTVAGTTVPGFSGDGGLSSAAQLSSPTGLAIDGNGNLILTDTGNNRLRKLQAQTPILFTATPVGSSSSTFTLHLATVADESITSIVIPVSAGNHQEYTLGAITGCVVDGATVNVTGTVCNIPITFKPVFPGSRDIPLQVVINNGQTNNGASGIFQTNIGLTGMGVGPLAGLSPGATTALSNLGNLIYNGGAGPLCAIEDFAGNTFVCDSGHATIKRVDAVSGAVTNFAGQGYASDTNPGLPANATGIGDPASIAFDSAYNLYFTDSYQALRRVNAITNTIDTLATSFFGPQQIAISRAGNIYIADPGHAVVSMLNGLTGALTTVAGGGSSTTSAGDGGLATAATLSGPVGVAVDNLGNLYIGDSGNNRIRKVDASTQIITTIAGNGIAGLSGDGGPAVSAQLSNPGFLALDAAGNLYVSDTGNRLVRRIDAATSTIFTIMGTGASNPVYGSTSNYSTPAPATTISLYKPEGLSITPAGNLLVSDDGGNIFHATAAAAALNYPTPQVPGTFDTADNPRSFNLANLGNAPLVLSTPNSGTNPLLPNGAALDSASTCPQLTSSSAPTPLAPGNSCKYAVDLTVLALGTNTSSISLQDNSLSTPSTQAVSLTSTGVSTGDTSTSLTLTYTPNGIDYNVNRLDYGTIDTITATVVHQAAGVAGSISGTAAFFDNGNPMPNGGSISVTNGIGTFVTTNITFGQHTITATFTPAANSGLVSSTSPGLPEYSYQAYPVIRANPVEVTYDGQPHLATFTSVRPGLAYTYYYTSQIKGLATRSPTEADTYSAYFTPTDPNYGSTSAANAVIIDFAQGAVNVSNLTAVYDGHPHGITITTTPANQQTFVNYNGSSNPPTAPGAYQLFAGIVGNYSNYKASITGTFIITSPTQSVWLVNKDSTVSHLSTAGAVLSTVGTPSTSTSTLGAVAIDRSGNAWTVSNGVNSLQQINPAGALTATFTGGGLNAPVAVAVDGNSQIWVANSNNTISNFNPIYGFLNTASGPISPSSGYQAAAFNAPSAIAVDQTGSVWVANKGSSTVTRLIGVAVPVVASAADAVTQSTTGARP